VRIQNSFVPVRGVGEKTERKLWRRGVLDWEDWLSSGHDVLGGRRADRIDEFVTEARPHLDDGDARYFDRQFPNGEQWRLYEDFREEACFFDIETTGLGAHADVTCVSVHRADETRTYVRGRDLTADRLRKEFETTPLVITYNGKRFDVPVLEREFDLSVETPHLDLMYPARKAGLTGGLSGVERAVGIERDLPDVDGEEAVRLWYRYARRGDESSLDRLVQYNREDTANLRPVADAVTRRLHREVFEPAVTDGG
jgi:uncharacterized protein YprB with RNaseH-like and TPR domain